MRSRVLAIAALAFALVGLGASIASLVDYFGDAPTFCAESGCATVRESAWARPLGIPLPVFGIAYFITMVVLAFLPKPRLRIALASAGGALGVALILIQAFAIGAWCKLCLIADPAAIAAAIAVVAGAGTIRPTATNIAATIPAAALAVLGLGVWTARPDAVPDEKLPECVAREQLPGNVTIVEFVDFECPYCRELNKKLTEAVDRTKHPIRIVRKMVPLPSHTYAVPAAMAWCAADAQGVGDRMAQELFAAKPEDLTPAGCEAIAVRLGCDVMKYRQTFASAELRARIERDMADARAADLKGFPTIFIGKQKFEGSNHTSEDLYAAIERAAR